MPSGTVRDTPTLMLLKPQDEIASSLTALALASSPVRHSCGTCRGDNTALPWGCNGEQKQPRVPGSSGELLPSLPLGISTTVSSIVLISSEGSSCPAASVSPLPCSMPSVLLGGSWLNKTRCSLPPVGLQMFLPQAESCFSRENMRVMLDRQG